MFITAITYNITIDADLYSSRVTSRGLFKENSDRYLQKDAIVGPGQTCSEFAIHIQVRVPSPLPPWGLVNGENPKGRLRSQETLAC